MDYIGTWRSNYFEVKDVEAFQEWAARLDIRVRQAADSEQHWAFLPSGDDGDWPYSYYDEEADNEVEVDFPAELAKHLKEGSVAILMCAGAQGLRYLNGYALAINSNGLTQEVSLNDIYEKAKLLTHRPDAVSRAEHDAAKVPLLDPAAPAPG